MVITLFLINFRHVLLHMCANYIYFLISQCIFYICVIPVLFCGALQYLKYIFIAKKVNSVHIQFQFGCEQWKKAEVIRKEEFSSAQHFFGAS